MTELITLLFMKKLEFVQYNVGMSVIIATKGTLSGKLCQ